VIELARCSVAAEPLGKKKRIAEGISLELAATISFGRDEHDRKAVQRVAVQGASGRRQRAAEAVQCSRCEASSVRKRPKSTLADRCRMLVPAEPTDRMKRQDLIPQMALKTPPAKCLRRS